MSGLGHEKCRRDCVYGGRVNRQTPALCRQIDIGLTKLYGVPMWLNWERIVSATDSQELLLFCSWV